MSSSATVYSVNPVTDEKSGRCEHTVTSLEDLAFVPMTSAHLCHVMCSQSSLPDVVRGGTVIKRSVEAVDADVSFRVLQTAASKVEVRLSTLTSSQLAQSTTFT